LNRKITILIIIILALILGALFYKRYMNQYHGYFYILSLDPKDNFNNQETVNEIEKFIKSLDNESFIYYEISGNNIILNISVKNKNKKIIYKFMQNLKNVKDIKVELSKVS
jgi:hypothetical protein